MKNFQRGLSSRLKEAVFSMTATSSAKVLSLRLRVMAPKLQ